MLRETSIDFAALLLTNLKLLQRYGKYIHKDTFNEHIDIALVMKATYEYSITYEVIPTPSLLIDYIHTKSKNNIDYNLIESNLPDLVKLVYTTMPNDNVLPALIEVLQLNATIDIVNKIADKVSNGVIVTPAEALTLFKKTNTALALEEIPKGLSEDSVDDLEDLFKLEHDEFIPTGFDVLDSLLQGLSIRGEIGIIVASPNAGKTAILCAMARNMLVLGFNVMFITIETHVKDLKKRIWAGLTDTPINDLHTLSYGDRKIGKEFIDEWCGDIFFEDWIGRNKTVLDVEETIERYNSNNVRIDVIILDYIDILKFHTHHRELRLNLADMYKDLRGISAKYGIPVWSASQTNRGGANALLLTEDTIGEDFQKVANADKIISFNQTMIELDNQRARFFIMKTRATSGKYKAITLDTDFAKMRMYEDSLLSAAEHKELIADLREANKGLSTNGK